MTPVKISREELESMRFYMMPCDRGRNVKESYALDADGVVRKAVFDDHTEYQYAAFIDWQDDSEFDPENNTLPNLREWQPIEVIK